MKGFKQLRYISALRTITGQNRMVKQSAFIIREKLASFCNSIPPEDINDFIEVATKNHLVMSAINTSSFYSSLYFIQSQESKLPTKLLLSAFSGFCSDHSELINEFYLLKNGLESSIILGELEKALEHLDQIEGKFGKSIWCVDMRMNIFANPKYIDNGKIFAEKLSKEDGIKHISTLLNRKYQSSSLNSFYNQVLRNLLHEYRSSSIFRYADFLSCLLVPDFTDQNVDLGELIVFTQRLTPIDRLIIINKVAVRAMYTAEVSRSLKSDLTNFSKKLSMHLSHSSWKNIAEYSEGIIKPRLNEDTKVAIRNYSSGHYIEAINQCDKILVQYPTDMSVMDIKARSILYSGNAEKIMGSTSRNLNISKSILPVILSLLGSSDTYEITLETCETLFFKHLSFEFISSVKPIVYAVYPHKHQSKAFTSCVELYCSDFQISPKYIRFLQSKAMGLRTLDTLISEKELTTSRSLRVKIESMLERVSEPAIPSQINRTLLQLKTQQDILDSEYWSLWFRAKLACNELRDIVVTVANLLIESDTNQHLFPLDQIVTRMEAHRDFFTNDIHAVILYYKYFRLQSFDSKEHMSEFFEDYLLRTGNDLASSLGESWGNIDSTQFYFLKDVCNTEIMSILLPINSNEELLFERLKILNLLVRKNPECMEYLEQEEYRIFEELYIDIISLEHASNKIDINVNGIKKSKLSEYESFYELLSEFKEGVPEDFLALFEDSSEDGSSKVENAILHFYGRLYESVLEDFIFNEDFGLVRYLSSEIRHGWLPNQIRSVVESHNLVTEIGTDQKYEKAQHWRDVYELTVTESFLLKLDDTFSWFSEKVDALIFLANSWPEVTRDPNNRKVAFNFAYDMDELNSFRNFISTAESTEQFFELCSEYIWGKLDESFRVMRSLINKELKPAFNKLFDELLFRVNALGPELTSIKEAISNAKNKTIEEICIIEGWFCRPVANDIGFVALGDIFKVAITNVRGIFNPRVINCDLQEVPFDMVIERGKMLSLLRALVTAFQNCIKHGVKNDDTDIKITFSTERNDKKIIIENNIDKDSYQKAMDKDLVNRVERYKIESATDMLISEGGTGLYKIFRFTQDFSPTSKFRILFTQEKFYQEITLRE